MSITHLALPVATDALVQAEVDLMYLLNQPRSWAPGDVPAVELLRLVRRAGFMDRDAAFASSGVRPFYVSADGLTGESAQVLSVGFFVRSHGIVFSEVEVVPDPQREELEFCIETWQLAAIDELGR